MIFWLAVIYKASKKPCLPVNDPQSWVSKQLSGPSAVGQTNDGIAPVQYR